MQVNNEFEGRFTLIFPSAKTYAVNNILELISEAAYRHDCVDHVEKNSFFYGKWEDDVDECHQISVQMPTSNLTADQVTITELKNYKNPNEGIELPVSKQTTQELNKKRILDDYKTYLLDRLLKAVTEGMFELWDWTGCRVIAPPTSSSTEVLGVPRKPLSFDTIEAILNNTESATISNTLRTNRLPVYKTVFWWATMAFISKTDLIKFCKGERIHVIFEDEQTFSQITRTDQENNASPIYGIPCCQSMTIQSAQELLIENSQRALTRLKESCAHSTAANTNSPANDEPPCITKLTKTITKLAIRAAWEFEIEIGRNATPNEVLTILEGWADKGEGDGYLKKKIESGGVMWTPKRSRKSKPFGIDACNRALEDWHDRRSKLGS